MNDYNIKTLKTSLEKQKKKEKIWKRGCDILMCLMAGFFVLFLAFNYARMDNLSDFSYFLLFFSIIGFAIASFQHIGWSKCRIYPCEIEGVLKDEK